MLRIGLIGAGSIGKVHAANALTLTKSRLAVVCDADIERAKALAAPAGARTCADASELISAKDIDAVVIAASTPAHGPLSLAAANAGKPVYCEKPIAEDLGKSREIVAALKAAKARVMMGLNRRFDPDHATMQRDIRAGAVGTIQTVQVTSRGPNSVPTLAYLRQSGGLFRDKAVHHIDLVRWLAGEEPVEISAMGSVIADAIFSEADDFDTALITLRMKSGALAMIENARRAVYGYDDRIEVFGTKGMIESERVLRGNVRRASGDSVTGSGFPVTSRERYAESWKRALHAFEAFAIGGENEGAGLDDGLMAETIAQAATLAARERRIVKMSEIG